MSEFLEPSPEMRRLFLKCNAEMNLRLFVGQAQRVGGLVFHALECSGRATVMGRATHPFGNSQTSPDSATPNESE